jgi:hypothetical protein
MQADRLPESMKASSPPTKLEKILRRAEVHTRKQQEQARRQTARQQRQQEERQRCERLRELFHQAFVLAERSSQAPANARRVQQLTARLMALGRGIGAAGANRVLAKLPTPGTADVPYLLPLQFAIVLLQEAHAGHRAQVRAALDELRAHSDLGAYYQWFGVLADRLCGYADAMPGVPGKIVETPPLPAGCLTAAVRHEVERALGFSHDTCWPQRQGPVLAPQGDSGAEDAPGAASEQEPHLVGRHYNLLQAMQQLRAFTCDTRRTAAAIVERAEGTSANPEHCKKPLAKLKHCALVLSKVGRDGGYWLSRRGRALIERVRGK